MSDKRFMKPHGLEQALGASDPIDDDPMLAPAGRERRMNVRAYNYWASLLDGRSFPSVVDLEPDRIETFRDNSILLDFSRDPERPAMRYVGRLLRDECGLRPGETRPDHIPGRSMLSRLTDHYLEIIANRAPIGFEAEFANLRGNQTLYRGILLPLSDDGETINFIYGVISWKEALSEAESAELLLELDNAVAPEEAPLELLADDMVAGDDRVTAGNDVDRDDDDMLLDLAESAILTPGTGDASPLELVDALEPADETMALAPYLNGDLAEDLDTARAAADRVNAVDSRSRAALYEALDAAYRFYHSAKAAPEAYERLLREREMTMQDRAPFTPVVKLVFGADYDKTRLTEYAAAMSHAEREAVGVGHLRDYIERFEGGLKGLVKAERAFRAKARGNQRVDTAGQIEASLAARPALVRVPLVVKSQAPFVLLLARTGEAGTLEVIDMIDSDDKLIASALRKAARGNRKTKSQ